MATTTNQFRPDYAVPPGWILEERLELQSISHAEFARRCGCSPNLISEIIAGKASIEPETALQFEKVLGMDASIWRSIEEDYQIHRAGESEAADAAGSTAWLRTFPIQELVKRGIIRQPESNADSLSKLLSFFHVSSVKEWQLKYDLVNVAYRHSLSFKSNKAALTTWLRFGELNADDQECADYSKTGFKQALSEIRGLTCAPIKEALSQSQKLCNQSGVALALVKPLPKTAISGATWWLTPRKAVIQLSARHKSDDHLWFSFFHEAAHIHLHSKKGIFVDFVDEVNGGKTDIEAEANDWAANALIPRSVWERFVKSSPHGKSTVLNFSRKQGIAPGIVVGMLQHGGYLPWTHLNSLKVRYRWQDD